MDDEGVEGYLSRWSMKQEADRLKAEGDTDELLLFAKKIQESAEKASSDGSEQKERELSILERIATALEKIAWD